MLISCEFLNNIEIFKDFDFDKVIVDEAHLIKNPETMRYKNITSIKTKKGAFILLSGTVIQNSLEELWSLMSICNKDLLGQRKRFETEFQKVIKSGISSKASSNMRQESNEA